MNAIKTLCSKLKLIYNIWKTIKPVILHSNIVVHDQYNNIIFEKIKNHWWCCERDAFGNIIRWFHDSGEIETITYDQYGNVTKCKYNDIIVTESEYDEYGNIIFHKRPDGRSYEFKYDEYGNVIYSYAQNQYGKFLECTYDTNGKTLTEITGIVQ